MGYEFIDHPADIRVKAYGKDINEAFEQCAYSLMKSLIRHPENIEKKDKKVIEITGIDKESLLVNFLSEFLYIFDVDELVFSLIKVSHIVKEQIQEDGNEEQYYLKAECVGEKYDHDKHKPDVEVKAITYSYLTIEEENNSIKINVIFDI